MAAAIGQNVQEVGTDAAPIALSVNGGATDTWTWTHNVGRRAVRVEALRATDRQAIVAGDQAAVNAAAPVEGVLITQPTVNSIVVVNQNVGAVANIVLRVTWADASAQVAAPLASTVGVLSP